MERTPRPTLQTLPPELINQIISHMDPCPCGTVALSLTCHRFYEIHWGIHGRVPLRHTSTGLKGEGKEEHEVWKLLKEWMGDGYRLCTCGEYFFSFTGGWLGCGKEGCAKRCLDRKRRHVSSP